MKNVNSKVTISVLVLLVVLAFSSAFAVLRIFNLTATFDGKTLTNGQTVDLSTTV